MLFTAFSIIGAHSSSWLVENVHINVPSLETGKKSSTTILQMWEDGFW